MIDTRNINTTFQTCFQTITDFTESKIKAIYFPFNIEGDKKGRQSHAQAALVD